MFWLVALLLPCVLTLKMRMTFEPQQTHCFYQGLTLHQKYAIDIIPLTLGYYELYVRHQQEGEWIHSVYRQTEEKNETIKLHKVASHQALYSYCITNGEIEPLQLRISIRSGIELLDLKSLVEENDQERVEREAIWLAKQADRIREAVDGGIAKRSDRDQYANLMRKKMIGYAIAGLLALVAISVFFYLNLRKTFKERKLI